MPTHVQVFAPPGQWSAAYPGKFWEARETTIDYVTRWVPAVEALPAVETRRELMDFAAGGATIKQTTITRDFDAYGFARSVTECRTPSRLAVSGSDYDGCVVTQSKFTHDLTAWRLGRLDQLKTVNDGTVTIQWETFTYDTLYPWRLRAREGLLFPDDEVTVCSSDFGSLVPCASEVQQGTVRTVVLGRYTYDDFGQAHFLESSDGLWFLVERDTVFGLEPTRVINSEGHEASGRVSPFGEILRAAEGVGAQQRVATFALLPDAVSISAAGQSTRVVRVNVGTDQLRYVESSQLASGAGVARTLYTKTRLDGWGRSVSSEQGDETGSRDVVLTVRGEEPPPSVGGAPFYEPGAMVLERFERVSAPTRCGASPCIPTSWTETWFDPLGRPRAVYEATTDVVTELVTSRTPVAYHHYELLGAHADISEWVTDGLDCQLDYSAITAIRSCSDAWGNLLVRGTGPVASIGEVGVRVGASSSTLDTLTFDYNAARRLRRVKDSTGLLKEQRFDSWGRVFADYGRHRGWISRTFTDGGAVATEVHGANTRIYDYDSLRRLRHVYGNGQLQSTFNYDEAFGVYPQGRLTSMENAAVRVELRYGLNGRVSQRSVAPKAPLGNVGPWVTNYLYDSSGRTYRKNYPQNRSLEFSYAGWDHATTRVDGGLAVTFSQFGPFGSRMGVSASGVKFERSFDGHGRVTQSLMRSSGGTMLTGRAYQYRPGTDVLEAVVDQRTSTNVGATDTNEGSGFTNDDAGRLRRYAPAVGTFTDSTYTAVGEPTRLPDRTYASPSACGSGGTRFGGTAHGAGYTACRDAMGRVESVSAASGAESFAYDALDQLVSHTAPAVTTQNAFAPNGGRLARTQTWGGVQVRTFFVDEDYEVVRDGAGNTSTSLRIPGWGGGLGFATTGALPGQHSAAAINGGVTGPLASSPFRGRVPGTTFVDHDVVGSVNAVVSAAGAVLTRYRREPFGLRRSYSRGYDVEPTDMMGNVRDPLTSLVDFGARFYDARLGMFLTRDPQSDAVLRHNQRGNEFGVSANQPTSFPDVDGREPFGAAYLESDEARFGSMYSPPNLESSATMMPEMVPVVGSVLLMRDGAALTSGGFDMLLAGSYSEAIGRTTVGVAFMAAGGVIGRLEVLAIVASAKSGGVSLFAAGGLGMTARYLRSSAPGLTRVAVITTARAARGGLVLKGQIDEAIRVIGVQVDRQIAELIKNPIVAAKVLGPEEQKAALRVPRLAFGNATERLVAEKVCAAPGLLTRLGGPNRADFRLTSDRKVLFEITTFRGLEGHTLRAYSDNIAGHIIYDVNPAVWGAWLK